MFNFAPKTKRAFSGFMLVVQLFVFGVSSVGFPTEVRAVGGVGDTSITIGDLPQMALNVLMNALKQVGAALQLTAVEVASYLGQKVAHDAAVHLVAGASGQKPLFNAKDASEYVLDLGKDVAAQTLSGFVDNLAHIDICTFDPRTSLNLALGFAQTAGPIGRKCDFKALSNRFNKVKDEVASFAADPAKGFAAQMSVKFSPGNSTLDGFTEGLFGSINETQKKVAAMKDADLLERIGDVKGVKDPVTKKVKTPKEIVAAKSNDDLVQKPARDKESAMNAALNATGEEVVKIIGLTAKTFVATLLGEATKKIFAGLAPTPAADLANPFAPSSTGVAEANQALRSLLAVEPASIAQYDQVGQFSACPQGSGIHRNPDNCVINQQFAAAIRRGTTTTAVTIREALEQGSLQGDFPFIGPNDARNQDPNCYLQGYCYSNLVKLRRARVISIGWEMAAIVAERERQGTTLKEVVDSFDGNNLQSFKHLIDPNWILKYPATQCRQMVNGAVLLSDRTPDRQQVCVDTPSCIQEDGKGNCLGAYGYCTKEKNVWRFDGDACPKEMSSCLAFTRPDNTKAAYLTNTLDAGLCNSSTAGCRNYLWNATPTPTSLTGAPVAYIMNPAGTGSQFKVASDDPYVAANPTPYTTFSVGDLVEIGVAGAKKNVTVTNIQKQGTDINMTVSEAVTWGSSLADHRIVKMQVTGSSIYLNKSAGVCNGSDKGCTELVDLTTKNSPANMFKNPSFEIDENADTRADGWNGTNVVSAANAYTGGNGLALTSGQSVSQYVVLQPNVYYTVSASAKSASGSGQTFGFSVVFTDASGAALAAGSAPSPASLTASGTYARYSSTFATPAVAGPVTANVSITSNGSIAIDDVQLEYGETMTAYHEQYPYDAQKLTMKIPPAYLGCTGAATDNAECRNYAGVCAQSDVGCERYTPTNGDPAVNGALSQLDLCPAACVGYDTFKQLGYSDPTLYGAGFEQEKFPVFFSPTFPGARSCSIASAGCDEFTNMQAAATGGESRQYYSKLRKCQVASGNTDTATYYTWEGSDTAGLQLKTWKLKKSNVDTGPCTYAVWSGGNGTPSGYQCNDAAVDSSGNQLGMYDGIVATKQPYCKSHADVALNPDCREFYDEAGVTHYRLLSHTIVSADSCTQLRKTTVAAAPAGRDDCLATGGQWNAGASQCVYFALPNESLSCGQAEVGCRAYRGNAGGNTRQVYSETFETIVPSAGNVIPNYTGLYSTESLAANGHSIASQPAGVVIPLGTSISTASTYQMSLWAKSSASSGSTLNWQLTLYKDVGGIDTVFGTFPTASEVIGPVMNDWVRLVTNPLIIPSLSATVKKATLTITASSGSSTFYVDNIEIREVQSTVAFIKNSWTVPAACDQTLEGASSPQEMLGCREYADRMSRRVTARSFTRLCGDNAVGCKAFADTQNSVSPNSQIYGARCYAAASVPVTTTTACNVTKADGTTLDAVCQVLPGQTFCRFNTNEVIRLADLPATPAINTAYKASDTVVVAPDTVKYLLDDPSKRCAAEVKGCYEFGAAQYSQDKKVIVGVGKKTLLNLPDQYTSTLCGQEQNFCDAFAADDGSIRYFKDPEGKISGAPTVPGKICEYRDDVVVNGNHFAGWFKKGTDNACDDTFVVGGGFNGVRKNADPNYDSWAAACAPTLSKCTEFRDPTDRSDEAPLGKSYFFMKNDRVLQNTCNQVSRREGCALFEDTTNPTKYWNAEATYAASDAQSGALANAVACENDSSNQACKNRCRLGFSDLQGNPEPTRMITSTLCVRDEDCSGLKIPGKRVTDARCVDIVSNNGAEAVGSTFESARDENLATRAKPLNNANLILKVRRDRECGEWLSCTTSSPVYDANKQETKEVCNEVRTCNRVVETNSGGTICSSFIDTPREALTRGAYQDRDISWKAGDISGYSIPGMVPPDRIGQVNVAGKCVGGGSPDRACVSSADCPGGSCMPNQDDPDLRLAHKIGTSICLNKANGSPCKMGYCKNNPTLTCTTEAGQSGQECGVGVCSMDNTKDGRCYDNTCVQLAGNAAEIDNPKLEEFDIVTRQPEAQSCRAYPETDGPVPATAVEEWKKNALIGDTYTLTSAETVSSETVQWSPLRKNPQYSGANVCSFAKTANGLSFRTCECRYSKATYGGTSLVKYYPQGTRSRIKPNVCAGGKYDGAACIPAGSGADDPCGPEGSCVALQKIDNASGEMGYCLQRDLSVNVNGNNGGQACAVWLPVDALPGSVDMYNQDENAGFVPPEDDLYYCAASPGRSTPDGKATQQPYVNTFVNEANLGVVCSAGVNACDAPLQPFCSDDGLHRRTPNQACTQNSDCGGGTCVKAMTRQICESRATDLLGNSACVFKDGVCQTVIIPIPKPPGIDTLMPGCLPTTGLKNKHGNDIANGVDGCTIGPGEDARKCFLSSANACEVNCGINPPATIDSCVGIQPTPPFLNYYSPNSEGKCNGSDQKVTVPAGFPVPNCTAKVANCCLPQGPGSDLVKGFITSTLNLNPSTYKVCADGDDWRKVSVCAGMPNFSIGVDSCLQIDNMIMMTTKAVMIALTALAANAVLFVVLGGYGYVIIGAALAVFSEAAGGVIAALAAKCGELTLYGVCDLNPSPNKFMFTSITPFPELAGIFPQATGGASSVRLSPRMPNITLPASPSLDSILNQVANSFPLRANLPINARRDEIAAVKVTVSGPPDVETRAVPRQFFLLPPKFEASFWWNGGEKAQTNATEDGKAVFRDSYTAKCGDEGIDCPNAISKKTCEEYFSEASPGGAVNCAGLVPSIKEENAGVENCAAIKARFGRCSNQAGLGCSQDSDCGSGGTCLDRDIFQGFRSGMCIRSNVKGGALPVKVEVLMRESCSVLAQTARTSETSFLSQSVSYTDRLWDGKIPSQQYSIPQTGAPTYTLVSPGRSNASSDPYFPFGRLDFKGTGLTSPIPLAGLPQTGTSPTGPFAYFKNASETDPPLKAASVSGLPIGGNTYSCPQNTNGAVDTSIPSVPPELGFIKVIRLAEAFLLNKIAAFVSFGAAPDSLGYCTNNGALCCANQNGICNITVPLLGYKPVWNQLKSDSYNACGGPNLCKAATSFTMSEVTAAFGSQTASESCVALPQFPALGYPDAAKQLLSQLYARSFGTYAWMPNSSSSAPWNFVSGISFCSNAPNRTCSTVADCNNLKDQYGRFINPSGAPISGGLMTTRSTANPKGVACISSSSVGWDVRNPDLQVGPVSTLDASAHEPYIYPIKQSSCRPTDGKCQMDLALRNSITVNDKNDGVVTGAGTMKATVKFYFEADKNHMPGKRIVVDWGDRSDTTDLSINYGLYKNRIGLRTGSTGTCDATTKKCSNTGLACAADADCKDGEAGKLGCDADQTYCSNDTKKQCTKDADCGTGTCSVNSGFGRSSRACENAYIAFSHTYTCDDTTYSLGADNARKASPVSVGKCDGAGGGTNGMCRVDADCAANVKCVATGLTFADEIAQKCIFKPRVMVLDNWGWCNGVCKNDTQIQSDICYSGTKQDGTTLVQDCDPSIDDPDNYPFPSINPWAKFNGTIEVRR